MTQQWWKFNDMCEMKKLPAMRQCFILLSKLCVMIKFRFFWLGCERPTDLHSMIHRCRWKNAQAPHDPWALNSSTSFGLSCLLLLKSMIMLRAVVV